MSTINLCVSTILDMRTILCRVCFTCTCLLFVFLSFKTHEYMWVHLRVCFILHIHKSIRNRTWVLVRAHMSECKCASAWTCDCVYVCACVYVLFEWKGASLYWLQKQSYYWSANTRWSLEEFTYSSAATNLITGSLFATSYACYWKNH